MHPDHNTGAQSWMLAVHLRPTLQNEYIVEAILLNVRLLLGTKEHAMVRPAETAIWTSCFRLAT